MPTTYVTSIVGSSHHWTSDGASSVYAPTADSFRIFMFREGDHNNGGNGVTGSGSGGGDALTAGGAIADHWKINFFAMQ